MRNAWVDYAKGIGILLVVYGHAARGLFSARIPVDPTLYHIVDAAIYSFHMPLFFFLAGIFFFESFEKRGPVGLLTNKANTILYPYLVWSIFQGCIEVALSQWTNGHAEMHEIFELLWAPRAQLWFLYVLFMMFAATTLLYRYLGTKALAVSLLFGTTLHVCVATGTPTNVLAKFMVNFVYFGFGLAFKSWQGLVVRHVLATMAVSGPLFLVAQYFVFVHSVAGLEMNRVIDMTVAAISTLFVVTVCMWLSQWRIEWLKTLGSLSMAIYLAHILTASGTRILLVRFLHLNDFTVHVILGTLAGVLLPLLLARLAAQSWLSVLFKNPFAKPALA